MHLLPRMPCLISFERCQSSCEENETSEHYKKILVYGKIRTNTARAKAYSSLLKLSLYNQPIGMNEGMKCPWNLYLYDL